MDSNKNKKDEKVWIQPDPLGIQPGYFVKKMKNWQAALALFIFAGLFYLFILFIQYQGRKELDYFTDPDYYSAESGYIDGIFCAMLNEGKSTKQKNNVLVEIKSDQVINLFIPGRGWLDDNYYVYGEVYSGLALVGTNEENYSIHLTVVGSEEDCLQKDELTNKQIDNLLKLLKSN